MSSLGTLEIHVYCTKREYLGKWHPDYTDEEDFLELLRSEAREDGFCDFVGGVQELEALKLPNGSLPNGNPNPLTISQVICHLIPVHLPGRVPTSLPLGTKIYVMKAVNNSSV